MLRHAAIALAILLFGAAHAQAPRTGTGYPSRPIRLILTFPPGGSTDIVARIFAPVLSERLGKPVIIDNRPGAGGILGADIVSKAAPDGYTLLVAPASVMAFNPILYQKLPYDPDKDLEPITLLVSSPFIVAVNPELMRVGSVRELIDAIKAKPGQVPFASGGNGSGMHLAGELFRILGGLDMIHVPYKGNGPALSDLSAGQVPIAFVDLGSTSAYRKSERVRILAVAAKQRTVMAPDIPTSAESGLPGWDATGWYGLVATGGTPQDIIGRLNAEMTAILRLPEVRERILATSNEPAPTTPGEFRNYVRTERERWARVIRQAGIKAD